MVRFKFNKEQLNYIEDMPSVWRRVWQAVRLILASMVLSVVYYLILSQVVFTGEEARLQRRNKQLRAEYKTLQRELGVVDGTVASLQMRDVAIYRSIFKAEPPASIFSRAGLYGRDVDLDTVKENVFIKYMSRGLETSRKAAAEVSESINEILLSLKDLGPSASHIPSIAPIKALSYNVVGASTGNRINPFYKSVVVHRGVDLLGAVGTEIYASASGVVESVERKNDKGSGNVFVIDHENGYKTRYANVGEIYVRKGQMVKLGALLGRIGVSGMSIAPHLHYEVIFNGKYVNPVHYFFADLTPREYAEVVNVSQNTGQSMD